MATTTLFVTNNLDRGPGSFRDAIQKTQSKEGGDFNIIFKSNEEPDNNLATGYFTIPLESPLPNIFRNNVNINVDNPRSVILIPKLSSGGQNLGPGKMNNKGPEGVNGSMLYVGDTNYLFKVNRQYSGDNQPDVHINNVHFVRNQAQGGAGHGAGGGYGAGGAITLTSGNLKITNAVFQDLEAKGGSGARNFETPAKPLNPCVCIPGRGGMGTIQDFPKYENATRGIEGKPGGLTYIPLRVNDEGSLAYNSEFLSLAPAGGEGGGKGANRRDPLQGFFPDSATSIGNGKRGEAGKDATSFGYGGGSGGGGGGAGASAQGFITRHHRPGQGGSGGNLNGKSFNFSWNISNQVETPLNGPGKGIGNPLDKGENVYLFGGQGGVGGDGTGVNRTWSENNYRQNGSAGADGPSSIGVWDVPARDLSGKKIKANLYLQDVTFIQDPEELIILSLRDNLFGSNVNYGAEKSSLKKANFKPLPGADSINLAPIKASTSSPRAPEVADINNPTMKGSALSDVFYVNVEDRSTMVGLTTNTTDPNNPFNKIWSKLVPDKSSDINEEYQSKANASYREAIFDGDRLEDLAKTVHKDAVATVFKSVTNTPKGFGAKTTSDTLVNMTWDTATYFINKATDTYERERDEKLAENAETQKDLLEDLTDQSRHSFAAVDVSLERTSVVIEDFELGKDIIYLPAGFDKEKLVARAGKGKNSGKQIVDIVELSYSDGSNQPQTVLTLELSKETVNALRNANQTSTVDAINSMLKENDEVNMWLLGTKVSEASLVTATSFRGGPGGESLIVDRLAGNSLALDRKITIETSLGSDFIYGSDGVEDILTGANDDIILPGFAPQGKPDSINGGSGSDLVSYLGKAGGDRDIPRNTLVPEPVNISATNTFTLEVKKFDDKNRILATLKNIENIQAYGSSSIDLSEAVNPNPDDSNSLSVGSGGTIIGNDQKQDFTISYDSDFNKDTKTSYETTTFIDGKGNEDTLKINFSNQPEQIGEILQVKLPNNNIGFIKGSSPVPIDSLSTVSIIDQIGNRLLIEVANVETLKIVDKQGKETVQNTNELDLPLLNIIDKSADDLLQVLVDYIKPQKLEGTDKKDVLIATSRRDTLLGGLGNDQLIGAVTDDPLKIFDDEDNFLSTRFFDGPGNDLIEPKEGFNFIVLGSGRNKLVLPESENFMDGMNTILIQNGKNKIFNFNSSRDNLAFDGIESLSISPTKSKKKALRNGDNIVIAKNKIFHLNDGASRFSSIKFINPVDFSHASLIENFTLIDLGGFIPFDLF